MALPACVASEEDEERSAYENAPAGYARLMDDRPPYEHADSLQDNANGEVPAFAEANPQANADGYPHGANGFNPAEPGATVVRIHGMDVSVYGDVNGLQFLQGTNEENNHEHVDGLDSEEEEEEEQKRTRAEMAILEANEADAARRSAPLSPERCTEIKNAMRGVTLGGFRPDWADHVPEEQWISKLRSTTNIENQELPASP